MGSLLETQTHGSEMTTSQFVLSLALLGTMRFFGQIMGIKAQVNKTSEGLNQLFADAGSALIGGGRRW